MSLSLLVFFDLTVLNAPQTLQRIVCPQGATPEELQRATEVALAEIVAENVAIAANPDLGPDLEMTIADASLSGGGDGHSFVLTITLVPAQLNLVGLLLNFVTGLSFDLRPQFFSFRFALAGNGQALEPLFQPLLSELIALAAQADLDNELFAPWNMSAGAAKGTRFMIGVGGITSQPVPDNELLLARATVSSSESGGGGALTPAERFAAAIESLRARIKK